MEQFHLAAGADFQAKLDADSARLVAQLSKEKIALEQQAAELKEKLAQVCYLQCSHGRLLTNVLKLSSVGQSCRCPSAFD